MGGTDSRTLHLQVHLAHLGKPVAEIHGKLFDHCRGGGRRERSESVSCGGRHEKGRGRRRRKGEELPPRSLSPLPLPFGPGAPRRAPHARLTLEVVLQVQHGGGGGRARRGSVVLTTIEEKGGGVGWFRKKKNTASSLPIWRRHRQQHHQLNSAKTTLAADGSRFGRRAIGCLGV